MIRLDKKLTLVHILASIAVLAHQQITGGMQMNLSLRKQMQVLKHSSRLVETEGKTMNIQDFKAQMYFFERK